MVRGRKRLIDDEQDVCFKLPRVQAPLKGSSNKKSQPKDIVNGIIQNALTQPPIDESVNVVLDASLNRGIENYETVQNNGETFLNATLPAFGDGFIAPCWKPKTRRNENGESEVGGNVRVSGEEEEEEEDDEDDSDSDSDLVDPNLTDLPCTSASAALDHLLEGVKVPQKLSTVQEVEESLHTTGLQHKLVEHLVQRSCQNGWMRKLEKRVLRQAEKTCENGGTMTDEDFETATREAMETMPHEFGDHLMEFMNKYLSKFFKRKEDKVLESTRSALKRRAGESLEEMRDRLLKRAATRGVPVFVDLNKSSLLPPSPQAPRMQSFEKSSISAAPEVTVVGAVEWSKSSGNQSDSHFDLTEFSAPLGRFDRTSASASASASNANANRTRTIEDEVYGSEAPIICADQPEASEDRFFRETTAFSSVLAEETQRHSDQDSVVTLDDELDRLLTKDATDECSSVSSVSSRSSSSCGGKVPTVSSLWRNTSIAKRCAPARQKTFVDAGCDPIDFASPQTFASASRCRGRDFFHSRVNSIMERVLETQSESLYPPQSRPQQNQSQSHSHSQLLRISSLSARSDSIPTVVFPPKSEFVCSPEMFAAESPATTATIESSISSPSEGTPCADSDSDDDILMPDLGLMNSCSMGIKPTFSQRFL